MSQYVAFLLQPQSEQLMKFGRHEDKQYIWVYQNTDYGTWCSSNSATAASFERNPNFDRWLAWYKHAEALRAPFDDQWKADKLAFCVAELAKRRREALERAAAQRRAVEELNALRASTARAEHLCEMMPKELLMLTLELTEDIPSILGIACVCKELRKTAGRLHEGTSRPRLKVLAKIIFPQLAAHQSEIKGGWIPRAKPLADTNIIGNGGHVPHPAPWWRDFQKLSSIALVDGQYTRLSVVRDTTENFDKLMYRSWCCKRKFLKEKDAALETLGKLRRTHDQTREMITFLRFNGRLTNDTDHPASNKEFYDHITKMRKLKKALVSRMKNMAELNEEHNLCLKLPSHKYDSEKGEKALLHFLEPPGKRKIPPA